MACVRKRRGKWVIDFYDQFGDRHWETVGTNKKEAEERLSERILKIGKGDYTTPKDRKITFSVLAERWLTSREGKIRPITIQQYEDHLNKHLLSFFGPVKIGQIDSGLVEAYIASKRKEGSIGIATINKTVTTLGTIFKYARRNKLIDSNPVSEVERPKEEAQEYSPEKEEIQCLTKEQIPIFLGQADEGFYKTLFTTDIMTGMREGEILGLQWGDIDWISNQVIVRRTLTRTKDGWWFYEPKSKYSKRRIDIDPILTLELKKWKLSQPKSEPTDLVFASPSGQPVYRGTLYKQGFLPTLRRAKLPRIRFHDLRHTYASLLIDQGENPKYIQTQMGHSSIKITMDIYGHLMEKVNVKSASRLAKTVFGEVPDEHGSKMVANGDLEERETSKSLNSGASGGIKTHGPRIRNPEPQEYSHNIN